MTTALTVTALSIAALWLLAGLFCLAVNIYAALKDPGAKVTIVTRHLECAFVLPFFVGVRLFGHLKAALLAVLGK